MDRVQTSVLSTTAISPAEWDDIWALTSEFFDVERDYAEAELRKRQSVALFRMNGALLGMAAVDINPTRFRGRRLAVISTTHVLIRENWRGRNLIQKLGVRMYLRARLRYPLRPIYWFFDTFSYKSYLLLPRNFHTYWPRHDQPTPEPRAALIDQLAKLTYGPAWRPARGLAVRSGQKRLRETAAPLVLRADASPDLQFFARMNPGHAEGDMLVCLCPLTLSNWLSVARKVIERRARRGR
ncbi:MAG: hypothetical protein ABI821_01240 [Pseudomonadota bacterium]